MGKKILLLSGGGSKGAFQAGVIEQLYKSGWRADVVAGVSVGALNGSMVASGQAMRLTGLWRNLIPDMVLKERGALRTGWRYLLHKAGVKKPTLGYYDNSPLFETVKTNLGNRWVCDFYCGTVDINTGRYYDHKGNAMNVPWNMIPEIIGSTAIPGVFDPVEVRKWGGGTSLHVDGGVKHMNPIGSVLKNYRDIEEVVIVVCKPYKRDWAEENRVRDIVDVVKLSLGYLLDEIFEKDLRDFERINRLVRQAGEQGASLLNSNGVRYSEYKARLFQPDEELGDSLNFTSEQAIRNIDIGLNAKAIEL